MRRYETFVIIDPDLSDDGRKPIMDRIGELVQQNGTMVLVDDWGQRRLAYEIKSKNRGYYVRFDYCGDGPLVDEIERFCRIEDGAMKYMTVVLDKDVDMEAVQKEVAENQAKADAAAKAANEAAAAKAAAEAAAETTAAEAPAAETAPEEPETPSETSETPVESADASEPSTTDEEPKDE